MTVRAFRKAGDPILKQRAEYVTHFGPELLQLAQDLLDTARAGAPGLKALGLSAPQIGVGQRVIVVGIDVYVNPTIVDAKGDSVMEEMCFSEPGVKVKVRRHKRVTVKYQDLDGNWKKIKATGMTAHIFQHEIDHLDGVLMSERARRGLPS